MEKFKENKKSSWKSWLFWIILIVVIIGIQGLFSRTIEEWAENIGRFLFYFFLVWTFWTIGKLFKH